MPVPTRGGGTSTHTAPVGFWRARITRIVGNHLYVTVPRLRQGHEFGPCEVLEGWGTQHSSDAAQDGTGHTHDLTVKPWAKDDRVLVTFLEGRTEGLVVIGRLQS